MSATPSFVGAIKTATASIVNGDSTTFKDFITAGASGTRIDIASVTNGDASNAYVVQLAVQIGSTDYVLGEVTVPAGAGTNGSTKAANLLNAIDLPALGNTLNVLFLQSGAKLRVRAKTAVAGVNQLHFIACAGDY